MALGYLYGQVDFLNFSVSGPGLQFGNNVWETVFVPWPTGTGMPITGAFRYEDTLRAQVSPAPGVQAAFYGQGITVSAGVVTGGTVHALTMGSLVGDAVLVGFNVSAVAVHTARSTVSTADDLLLLRQALAGDDNLRTQVSSVTNDRIFGGAGYDQIYSYGGNDTLEGDAGDDAIFGGGGNDALYGGDGGDLIEGGDGNDGLVGWAGGDTLLGGQGGDFIQGATGNDSIMGGLGDDTLWGNQDNDTVIGDDGNDDLKGQSGDDRLVGANGNDDLSGETGNDTLIGGAGADSIRGNNGVDLLTGNLGDDRFYYKFVTDGGDAITDFTNVVGNNDIFYFSNTSLMSGLPLGTLNPGRFQSRIDNLAQDANDRFIFRTTDNTLWIDSDGAGSAFIPTMMADLQAGAIVTAADIFIY